MTFKFAVATDVTELANKVNAEYKKNGYVKVFLTPDVKNIWINRVLQGARYEEDEGYVDDEDSFILESERVDYETRLDGSDIPLNLRTARKILENDSFENWECVNCDTLEDAIEIVDGGWGINQL